MPKGPIKPNSSSYHSAEMLRNALVETAPQGERRNRDPAQPPRAICRDARQLLDKDSDDHRPKIRIVFNKFFSGEICLRTAARVPR